MSQPSSIAARVERCRLSLADTLAIVLPDLPPTLANDATRARLRRAAEHLPPIALGGFECRLGPGETQVDLFQCVTAETGRQKLLAEYAAQTAMPGPGETAWRRVGEFAAAWAGGDSSLRGILSDVWLEFDLEEAAAGLPAPSLFLTLDPETAITRAVSAAVQAALEGLLGGPLPRPVLENLGRCMEACRQGGRISHLGVMLARPVEALRINVAGLAGGAAEAYLERAGWAGPTEALRPLLRDLDRQVEQITLGLDVGREIYPRLGLECAFKEQPPYETRWSEFLETLAKQSACAPEKAEALLAWPGGTAPAASAAPWPEHLIAEALTRPADQLEILGRRLSHVKLTCQPGRAPQAKGYLGFGLVCLAPGVRPAPG